MARAKGTTVEGDYIRGRLSVTETRYITVGPEGEDRLSAVEDAALFLSMELANEEGCAVW